MITTIAVVLFSALIVFAFDSMKKRKHKKNDAIRRESISNLADELSNGVKEILVDGVSRRNSERFLVSGIFSHTPSYRLGKGKISHKSRIVLSDKSLIVLDWSFENRWDWGDIKKVELYSDGFTIYPENDDALKFKTSSVSREEMEVITLMGMESVHHGTISNLSILDPQVAIEA